MLRFHSTRSRQAGFSLVELAIVVGVTGLLFGGLWRLMSSGNAQLREQTAADQMNQIVGATRNFLSSQEGQNFITAQAAAAGAPGVAQLRLPNAAVTAAGAGGCAAALNTLQGGAATVGTYCNFLPAGFWTGAGGTNNSYNQGYEVYVRKLDGAAGTPAQNYDFIVLTTGGDAIPDSSGGRIAANIGANGGFVFNNDTCGAPAGGRACGAYGSFNLVLTNAGPAAANITPGPGHIVTLNSSTLSATANAAWLARIQIPGDAANPPLFNTMTVPLHMQTGNAAPINMRGNALNMNTAGNNAAGGAINLQGGTINGPGGIDIDNSRVTQTAINIDQITMAGFPNNILPTITIRNLIDGSNAIEVTSRQGCDPQVNPAACNLGLNIDGNANITGFVNTGVQRSAVFIYTSDIRLKRDLARIPNALDRLTQLNGYKFSWKKDGRPDLGLMAQEVQRVFPELVHASAEPGNLGVEYGNLVAPMIEAFKELKQQNIELRSQLRKQQRQIEALQHQINRN